MTDTIRGRIGKGVHNIEASMARAASHAALEVREMNNPATRAIADLASNAAPIPTIKASVATILNAPLPKIEAAAIRGVRDVAHDMAESAKGVAGQALMKVAPLARAADGFFKSVDVAERKAGDALQKLTGIRGLGDALGKGIEVAGRAASPKPPSKAAPAPPVNDSRMFMAQNASYNGGAHKPAATHQGGPEMVKGYERYDPRLGRKVTVPSYKNTRQRIV